MAQFSWSKIEEGPSHLVLQINLLSDGSGELANAPIFSPADCSPALSATRPRFIIREIWYGLVWFDVTIKFAANTPATIWTLARDCDSHTDFCKFGGIPNYQQIPPDPSATGVILFSTNGFTTAGEAGSIILDMRKIVNARDPTG